MTWRNDLFPELVYLHEDRLVAWDGCGQVAFVGSKKQFRKLYRQGRKKRAITVITGARAIDMIASIK